MASNDQIIWDYFKAKGLNEFGIAGLMGNLQAESGLRPNNVQNSFEKKVGNDEEYTTKVDNGTYTNFVHDSAGYGLAQWTYWSRKENLLNFAKQKKASIGDLTMQLDFLYHELSTGYKSILEVLKNATSVLQASNEVLMKFERPADQGTKVQNTRASYGQTFYDKFANKATTTTQTTTSTISTTSTGYSNSSLVSYTQISPNKTSPRNHAIDTITIHCVVGQVSVERLGQIFAPTSKQASSNYGIGVDGRVGMYVEEKDRSWCSSNGTNDNRAITIECASDATAPYAVNDKVMATLIKLCADICKRNDIKKLVWSTDKNTRINHLNGANMTVHRDYANKSCPGDYLYNKHGYIADEVNKLLGVTTNQENIIPTVVQPVVTPQPVTTNSTFQIGDVIKLKANATYWNGKSIPNWVFQSTLYYRGKNERGIIFSTQKTGAVTGVVLEEMIEGNTSSFSPYLVRITADVLNIRKGPGTNYAVVGAIADQGIYTIVNQDNNWGCLKSGAGWICLDYTKKV